jgi:5-methyltetrahydrofolate--homocysteine methyltransferase
MNAFLKLLQEKVVIGDGAMGTLIQRYPLTLEDFGGHEGCNEYLNYSHPKVLQEIHSLYFEAGSDLVQTNSFGSQPLVLAEYGISEKGYELSKLAASNALEVARSFTQKGHRRFVAGSIGPGTKLVSLGHVSFDDMFASYLVQCEGLIDGGVDLFQIETCQDPLQIKCAVLAARRAMQNRGVELPIIVTFTVELTGTMLVGTDVMAVLSVLESLPGISMVGLNCATGPDQMEEHVRVLHGNSVKPIAILPNAGLPRSEEGRAIYDLTPEQLFQAHKHFVTDLGVTLVGGCCGTTPDHIRLLADNLGGLSPRHAKVTPKPLVSSLYQAFPIDQDGTSPLIVAERCNANGSKDFREHLLAENWDAIVHMAQEEAGQGAHVLDICTAYVGRDERRDMGEVLSRLRTQVTVPLMIDTTQLDVLEASLKYLGGRSIVNSINFEDGEDKFDAICSLARDYGAALVALTIDEEGMAKGPERKLAIAKRMYDRAISKFGLPASALIFDPLTFTIASGDEDSRKAGVATLEGIKLIKANLPEARTILGVSNVSFGLKPYPRQILNSVFLHEAIQYGLDAAIINHRKILPLNQIPPELVKITLDLIYDRRADGYDPLFAFITAAQGAVAPEQDIDLDASVEDKLRQRIIRGKKIGIEQVLDDARQRYSPVEIINTILLEGMKTVGELFGRGEMQLPFVLQSAETMKKAVSYLEQFMEKDGGPSKGSMVLATVRGDVHDIGKNLVDIILSNNGYKVFNLGIKQPLESILKAVEEHKPNAIGLSGLLVKSTFVMKENLEAMSSRGYTIPVICGGAALTRAYVEGDLRRTYATGEVYYGADAFTGLALMNEITGAVKEKKLTGEPTTKDKLSTERRELRAEREERIAPKTKEYVLSSVRREEHIPQPPFWGDRVVEDVPLSAIIPFINKKALYANQWQYRRGSRSTRDHKAFIESTVEPLFAQWCNRAEEESFLQPKIVYGYFPCASDKNELVIFDSKDPAVERCRINFPRQTIDKRLCIADFFRPITDTVRDVIAFHVVTVGDCATEYAQSLYKKNLYNDYLHAHGFSVEMAEALAEYSHGVMRRELGISAEDGRTVEDLFRQHYRGSRYSFGYPACPDLEDQRYIFELINPSRIGVALTSEWQLTPEQSTSALVVHHPEAKYFSL